jgi:uncharacterized spore protein YtfJ
MEINFEDMLGKVTDYLTQSATSKTVIGEAFTVGDFTCIPVVRIGMGFGSGGSGKSSTEAKKGGSNTGGAGAGLGISPIGFLVVKGDQVSFLSTTKAKGIDAIFEKVPDLLEKVLEKTKKKKEEE